MERRQVLLSAVPALAALGATRAEAGAVRALGASEYVLEGGNLRLNPEIVGTIVHHAVTDRAIYLSTEVSDFGPWYVIRWTGFPAAPEIVQGPWPDQEGAWSLRATPAGQVVAVSSDGCVAVLG